MSITLTERAIEEVVTVMDEQKFSTDEYLLEAGIAAGGCSGFSYKLGFKTKADVDRLNETIFEFAIPGEGEKKLEVAIDNRALPLVAGTEIDFHSGLDKRGFVFNNPNAVRGCGCGNSFSVG